MRSKGDPRLRPWRSAPAALVVLGILSAGRAAEEGDLGPRIATAVDRGRGAIQAAMPRLLEKPLDSYPMGNIALPLTALLKAGTSSEHASITRGFGELEKLPPQEVYSVVCYLMALDALAQTRHREARRGAPEGPTRTLRAVADGPARVRMEHLVRWLIAARNLGHGTWDYQHKGSRSRGRGDGPPSHDNSNTQFAVLGLAIAHEHGIPVAREVWEEVVDHFTRSILLERQPMEFTITFNPGKKTFLTQRKSDRTFKAPVGSWAYKTQERKGYASMTAAGASSLLAARAGLRGAMDRSGEAALEAGLGWIISNFDRFIADGARWYYYTLYSLEKVGDLGDILLFGRRDWYAEGAEEILQRQEKDGSWGSTADTSFAILFLTRATRPSVKALPAPRVITRAGGGGAEGGDRVYVDSIDGYISAEEFFTYLETTADRELLKVAEEVVRNYPLQRQGELVPSLLTLLGEKSDPISTFARKALKEVTGEEIRGVEGHRRWHEAYLGVRAAEEGKDREPERLSRLLLLAPGLRLRGRLIELFGREGLVECVPALIEELTSPNAEHRLRVADILERLTGQRRLLAEGGMAEAREAAAAMGAYWRAEGERLTGAARVRRLIAAIDAPVPEVSEGQALVPDAEKKGQDPRRERMLASLIGEGRAAVPLILEAMERPEFSARLLVALERISGKRLGLRPAAWKAWWDAEAAGSK